MTTAGAGPFERRRTIRAAVIPPGVTVVSFRAFAAPLGRHGVRCVLRSSAPPAAAVTAVRRRTVPHTQTTGTVSVKTPEGFAAESSPRLAFIASDQPRAQTAAAAFNGTSVGADQAEVLVVCGGDGFLLETIHAQLAGRLPDVPLYGLNFGTVGFLLNEHGDTEDAAFAKVLERVAAAEAVSLHPLAMRAETVEGRVVEGLAINEVSLFRQTNQAAQLQVTVNGTTRLDRLVGDGVLVASPAGSTAYNLSAHGPILPLGAALVALTPISAYLPRRWPGALLPDDAEIVFEVLDPGKRPVSATADSREVRDVARVTVTATADRPVRLLFDAGHSFEERVMREQFRS